jgi:hypothetical protein
VFSFIGEGVLLLHIWIRVDYNEIFLKYPKAVSIHCVFFVVFVNSYLAMTLTETGEHDN